MPDVRTTQDPRLKSKETERSMVRVPPSPSGATSSVVSNPKAARPMKPGRKPNMSNRDPLALKPDLELKQVGRSDQPKAHFRNFPEREHAHQNKSDFQVQPQPRQESRMTGQTNVTTPFQPSRVDPAQALTIDPRRLQVDSGHEQAQVQIQATGGSQIRSEQKRPRSPLEPEIETEQPSQNKRKIEREIERCGDLSPGCSRNLDGGGGGGSGSGNGNSAGTNFGQTNLDGDDVDLETVRLKRLSIETKVVQDSYPSDVSPFVW